MDNGRSISIRPASLPGIHSRPRHSLLKSCPAHVNTYVEEPSSASTRACDLISQTSSVTPIIRESTIQQRALYNLALHKPLDVDCHITNGSRENRIRTVITQQPISSKHFTRTREKSPSLLVKDNKVTNAVPASPSDTTSSASITCSHCHRCKCQACVSGSHQLPRTWLCHQRCECSPERTLEICSCLCAVRCLFYHCLNDDDENMHDSGATSADEPCGCCDQPHCCLRWTAISALAICMPCLCFYWPLRGVLSVCEKCYGQCHNRRGCRCPPHPPGTKRLLSHVDPESSSA